MGEYQCRFRPNTSIINQIFLIKQIQNNSLKLNLSLHVVFVDFEQTYDSVNRQELDKIIGKLKIPIKLICMINMILRK